MSREKRDSKGRKAKPGQEETAKPKGRKAKPWQEETAKPKERGQQPPEENLNEGLVFGRNATIEVLSALENAQKNQDTYQEAAKGKKPRNFEKIILQKGVTGSANIILAKAKELGVTVFHKEREDMEKILRDNGVANGNHQGVIGFLSQYEYWEVDQIIEMAKAKEEDPFIVILDGIEDPHNLGAIMRTCECAGVHGVVIPNRRAVGITETVIKTSAGATEHMACAKVTNIVATIEDLQKKGFWVGALDMDGEDYTKANLKGPLALIVGGEGKGISRLAREKSDFVVSLPIRGKVNSLNASNAAAIIIYEAIKTREKNRKI